MSRASYVLLCAAVFMLAMLLAGCGGGGDSATTNPDTSNLNPEDMIPEIQVQTVDHNFRVSGLTDDKLGNDPIFSIIASATSSLDIAITRINRQEVVEALIDEAQSGTQIRIVTEKAYYDAPNYRPFYAQLEDQEANFGNILIHTDNEGLPRLMHSRFLIIDQAKVVTGSYNWEANTAEYTYGDVISILHTGVAAAFTNQFNQMFVEGNFGIHKRNDTQHSFMMGGGAGLLEVYFGPTDQPRELLMSEIDASANIVFAIQQFKDTSFANDIAAWLGNPEHSMIGMFNDFGVLGDQDENAIYEYFRGLSEGEEATGQVYVNEYMDANDPGAALNGYNTMNHKLLLADNAYRGGASIIFTTGNYTDLAFTQNDEVMLIFRNGTTPGMTAKFWRGLDLNSSLPPDTLQNPEDIQEFDALACIWPFVFNGENEPLRDFSDVPCGIIYGKVGNFSPTVTIQTGDAGETEEVDIDLTFEMDGTLYWTGGTYEGVRPGITGDIFEENEIVNPDHRFMLVVPAGEVTLRTIVIDREGNDNMMFSPDEIVFDIGPGGVRYLNLKINQAGSGTQVGGGL